MNNSKFKEFDLIPYHKNIKSSHKLNSLNKNLINTVQNKIKKLVKSSNAILMHECKNFENFDGRDIDSFYIFDEKFLNVNQKDVILHQRDKGSFRFLINNKKTPYFINLDVEDISIFSPKTKKLNQKNIREAIKCNKTGLRHFSLNAIIFYKLIKYFSAGVVHSYEQLYKIKKTISSLSTKDLNYILKLTSNFLIEEKFWINKLIRKNFKSFELNKEIRSFWRRKRIIRQKKRKVFAGELKLKNLLRSKKFIYALLFGASAKWSKKHRALPAIAIVGNDGAGKTELCKYIIKKFSKLDPAYINMRSDSPIIPLTLKITKLIKKLCENKLIKKIFYLKLILSYLGQGIDIFDKYLRYKVGIAFADSGYGVTIFERYITDKLRGEFPNKNNKFLPLEQFFPLPDGIFYMDVMPKISLKRKKKDNHTLEEMKSKRKNYIKLLKEFTEVKKIKCGIKFNESVKELKNYIFELTSKKNKKLKSRSKVIRCFWKKNTKRVLYGEPKNRFQKNSFI